MEGKKAYILPGVAALVLLVLFVLRGSTSDDPPSAPAEQPPAAEAKGLTSTKAAIREAVGAAGSPALPQTASDALEASAQAVVKRCRSSRPDATGAVGLRVEAIAAQGVGARFVRVDIDDGVAADLAGCVREGVLGSKPDDVGATGQLSVHWEFDAA